MKRRSAGRWVTTVCLTVLAARTSLAERPPAPSSEPSESQAPSAESSPSDVDAWFREASEKFEAGDFAGALPLLERACAASAFPGCALNLGAVHHALRHCPEARRYYEQYLRAEPQGERVAEARAALTELEPHCKSNAAAFDTLPSSSPARVPAASTPAATTTATAVVPAAPGDGSALAPASAAVASRAPSRVGSAEAPTLDLSLQSERKYRPIAASMLMLGGAAGLTTLYLGVRLADANAEFRKYRGAAFDDEQQARHERTRQYRALTVGSGVASALLLGAGGFIWWLGDGPDADIAVGPNGLAGAQVSGRF